MAINYNCKNSIIFLIKNKKISSKVSIKKIKVLCVVCLFCHFKNNLKYELYFY